MVGNRGRVPTTCAATASAAAEIETQGRTPRGGRLVGEHPHGCPVRQPGSDDHQRSCELVGHRERRGGAARVGGGRRPGRPVRRRTRRRPQHQPTGEERRGRATLAHPVLTTGGVDDVLAQGDRRERPATGELGERAAQGAGRQRERHSALAPVRRADPRGHVHRARRVPGPRTHRQHERRRPGGQSDPGRRHRGAEVVGRRRRGRGAYRAVPPGHECERPGVESDDLHGVAARRRRPHARDRPQHRVRRTRQGRPCLERQRVVALRPHGDPGVGGHVERRGVGAPALQRCAVGTGEHDTADGCGDEADGHDGAQRTAYAARRGKTCGDGTRRETPAHERGERYPQPCGEKAGRGQREDGQRDGQRVTADGDRADSPASGDEDGRRDRHSREQLDEVPGRGLAAVGPDEHRGGQGHGGGR